MSDIASTPNPRQMSEEHFRFIADLAHKEAGLVFPESKAPLVRTRLNRRIRALKLPGYDAYCALLRSPEGARERRMMISSLTTNVSSFFREAHHFDLLRGEILPPLLEGARRGERLRLWSAGCSSGQEAYSIAMVLADLEPDYLQMDIRILASDIDLNVIETGRAGIYDAGQLANVPEEYRERYFQPAEDNGKEAVRIIEPLRRIVCFRELNLLHEWPMKRQFDVIFCRNVVIYFDAETQNSLWRKFEKYTAPGGWLILGHSERLSEDVAGKFVVAGPTAYRLSPTETA